MTDHQQSPSNSVKKKRVFIHSQAREMAKRVLDMCTEERQNNFLTLPLNNSFGRASLYTGLSKRTLSVIKKEAKQGPLRSPSRKGGSCNKKKNLDVNDFDRGVIHRTIEDFYLTKKIAPTCPKLLAAIKDKIEFPWGVTSLRKLLKEMGYKWQKCHNKHRILVERPAVMLARSIYLRKIRQYRQDNRNIFFLDETWVDNNLNFKTCWRNETINAVLTETSSTSRLIIVQAGSRHGFLNNAKLLLKVGTASVGYQWQMNSDSMNFEKWAKEILIPNLPPNSVIVKDHRVQENKALTMSCTKPVMVEWLTKNNVEASLTMRKDELLRLIKLHKSTEKTFEIDEIIGNHGHIIVSLPPYMCDLNPIELAWAKLKRRVRHHNVNSNSSSLTKLIEVMDMAVSQITEEDWRGFEDHIITLEEHYWQKDAIIEDTIDSFVMQNRPESRTDESSNSDITDILESDSD